MYSLKPTNCEILTCMLLFQLIQTLSADELEKLALIQLSPSEQKLLGYCIGIREKKIFAPTPALAKLGFSTAYLHKLTSIVLDKVLIHLYGNGFDAQVNGLAKKVKLVPVIRHLMKIRERQLLKQQDRKALLNFYETAFDFEVGNYSSDYNHKIAITCYKKCIEYAGKAADAAYRFKHELDILSADINQQGALSTSRAEKTLDAYQKRFDGMYTIAQKHKIYNLWVKALCINTKLYFDITDTEQALFFLDKAAEIVAQHPKQVSATQQTELQIFQCRALYFSSRFEESRLAFEAMDLIPRLPLEGVVSADVAKFIQVCLITGHYTKAKALLDRVFSRFATAQNSAGAMARLHIVKYLVYVEKYREALTELDRLDQLVRDTKVLQYMVETRMLYTIAQLLDGNRYEAASSAERSLKFLYSKKQPEQMTDFIEGFQLLRAFAKSSPITTRLQAVLYKYQYSAYKQYGELFNRIKTAS